MVLATFLFLVLFWSDVCKKRIRCGLSWVRQGSQAAAWPLVPPTPPTHPCFQSRVHYFSSSATLSQVCLCATLVYSVLPSSMPQCYSVLLCATSKYAAHCASSHLSPPSPSPRTFRRPRGRRPGSARGLLQRPGKLLEIQTSLDLFQRKDETQ